MNAADILLIRSALRFFVWAAGQGLSSATNEAPEPEAELLSYSIETGDDDWDGLADRLTAPLSATPLGSPTMSEPKRIQLSRQKGWRMPPNTRKIDRSTRYGNPWLIDKNCHAWVRVGDTDWWLPQRITVAETVGYFRRWLRGDDVTDALSATLTPWDLAHLRDELDQRRLLVLASIDQLRGQNVACWCPLDQPCHADVLLAIANQEPDNE